MCHVFTRTKCGRLEREDWLHYIEEDLKKFEEAERETRERLQGAFLDEEELDQLKKDKETIGESLCSRGNTEKTY